MFGAFIFLELKCWFIAVNSSRGETKKETKYKETSLSSLLDKDYRWEMVLVFFSFFFSLLFVSHLSTCLPPPSETSQYRSWSIKSINNPWAPHRGAEGEVTGGETNTRLKPLAFLSTNKNKNFKLNDKNISFVLMNHIEVFFFYLVC